MSDSRLLMRAPIVRLYGTLLQLYPSRFRAEFIAEIRDIFLEVMHEAEERGGFYLLKTSLREFIALVLSIFRECGHELRTRKEKSMAPENHDPKTASLHLGGGRALQTVGTLNWFWVVRWTLLTTAAYLAGGIIMPPLAALFLWFVNLGVGTGLWPGIKGDTLTAVGYIIAFSGWIGAVQWVMLRRTLPRAGWWFLATSGVVLLAGLLAWSGIIKISPESESPNWNWMVFVIATGLALGLAQWLYLRRVLPNAWWIILFDGLAASPFLLFGRPFTSWIAMVGVLLQPGLITGIGLWLLLWRNPSSLVRREVDKVKKRRIPRLVGVGLGLVAMIPLYFLCIWIYATSQLALTKNDGIYPTVEEAVIARASQDWGEVKVVRIENVHAGPNRADGSQPHVWFGGATVYLDEVSDGWKRVSYTTGCFYIHVREGWVFVSEGAFPEFIGWVMELYGLEGVRR